jgi:hypothetical protein
MVAGLYGLRFEGAEASTRLREGSRRLALSLVGLPDDLEPDDLDLNSSPPLSPRGRFVSASMLSYKAWRFDSGLSALCALAVERGVGGLVSQRDFCQRLSGALMAEPQGEGAELARWLSESFEAEAPEGALVPGVYSWTAGLARRHEQQRRLGRVLDRSEALRVASRLESDPALRQGYVRLCEFRRGVSLAGTGLDLCALLTLGSAGSVEEASERSLFPGISSLEELVYARLTGGRSAKPGLSSVGEIIRRLSTRQGHRIPSDLSPWCDYLSWALECLVSSENWPEAGALDLSDGYRSHLLELCGELIAGVREVMDPGHSRAGPRETLSFGRGSELSVSPALSTEPLAEFYIRRAFAYRFLRSKLEAAFGPGSLERVRRVVPYGVAPQPVAQELRAMETLFYGAYVTARVELGLAPDSSAPVGSGHGGEADAASFRAFVAQLERDPDLGQDARRLIPARRSARGKTVARAHLGWASLPLVAGWSEFPGLCDGAGQAIADFTLRRQTAALSHPVFVEVEVDRVPSVDEFRALCDREGSVRAIKAALKSL